ncbi:uncharacterized protein Gasu_38680 [Galdieria sulphuraria]|uniref:BZIP domain-containing protein n=1 Tax=Galdieria sulphuraria TaxID=130081 RepID=M2WXA2_GALSU|nr:uncharacterized protein Gasu_38680 [Galdieria sulphuraria]EME28660.1 hypothetical protein Gasu_38680 [Galdieria sulphuraria]|eukprot:XP_005705180.1 hypothetical protein Gasu_38680 [Galdieria sulphuraria]
MKAQTPSVLRALMEQERLLADYSSTNSTDISSFLGGVENETDVSSMYGNDYFLPYADPTLQASSNRSSINQETFGGYNSSEQLFNPFPSSNRYDGQNGGKAVFKDDGLEVLQNFRKFSVEEPTALFEEMKQNRPSSDQFNSASVFVSKNKRYSVEALSRQPKISSHSTYDKVSADSIISPQKRKDLGLADDSSYFNAGESDSCGTSNVTSSVAPTEKKAMRAERNRQSAAASRERKKQHIRELERRVSLLSAENAHLQLEQLSFVKSRIEREKRLIEENRRLKNEVGNYLIRTELKHAELEQVKFQEKVIHEKQSKIFELSSKLTKPSSRGALEKRVTWTPSSGESLFED